MVDVFTFLGEKFLGVFTRQNELSGNFPQQFDDQSYVICDTGEVGRSTSTFFNKPDIYCTSPSEFHQT